MKKSIFFVIFLNVISCLFSVELWNGFTTGMSEEQVLKRIFELFNINRPRYQERNRTGLRNTSLYFTTNNPAYPTVVTSFQNNKLIIIEVWWGSDSQTLLSRHRNQFGEPNETKTRNENYSNGRGGWYTVNHIDYEWHERERYIYLSLWVYPPNYPSSEKRPDSIKSSFIDRVVYDAWEIETNRARVQENENEETRRRSASEGIVF